MIAEVYRYADEHAISDSLDAAWDEAEAALPEGWWLQRVSQDNPKSPRPSGWRTGRGLWAYASEPASALVGRVERADGPNPLRALRALAEELREVGR